MPENGLRLLSKPTGCVKDQVQSCCVQEPGNSSVCSVFIVLPEVPFPVFHSLLRFHLSPPLLFEAPNKTSEVLFFFFPSLYPPAGSHTAEDSGSFFFPCLRSVRDVKNTAEEAPGKRTRTR